MTEFMLLFRQPSFPSNDTSPAEFQAIAKRWKDWTDTIQSQGRLGPRGNRLALEGKVLHARGVVTDGPFVEIRERLGGYLVIKAESLDEATTLAHGCPALDAGGSVEIRPIIG